MLKDFIRHLEQTPNSPDFQQRVEQMTQTFDGLVDFLRNPDSFPNQEINKLTTLMWRLIGNKHIPVALDPTGRMPSISFAVLGNHRKQEPYLFLPQNFIALAKEAPEVQIGAFAYMGSQCRDYFMGKITGANSHEVNRRAQAYEAETLITLKALARQEGIPLRLIPFQVEILRLFPRGLADLEDRLKYQTSEYNTLISPTAGDPRLN